MIRRLLPIALLYVLCACTPIPDIGQHVASLSTSPVCADAGPCIEVADPIAMIEACPLDRVISIDPTGLCPLQTGPAPGGLWTVAKLLPGAPGVLGTYCSYDWVSAGGPPYVAVLPLPFSADCNVVSPMASAAELSVAATFESAFLQQVGALQVLPKAGLPTPTKVAVVDSAVRSGPPHATAGRVYHGKTMQQIIERLACPDPTDSAQVCAASLYSTLALKLDDSGGPIVRNDINGGYFGSQGDLASAIYDAVADMQAGSGGDRMIINLSVAWEPNYGGVGAIGGFSEPVRAVHDALRYAACEGALVFAASGNHPGGPVTPSGPMLPAQWETLGAPTFGDCVADFGTFGPPGSGSTYRPLLYGVGGVDGVDELLMKSRPSSRPVLVAPSEHVTLTDRWAAPDATGLAPPTRFYTGTSIGPAVASGAAAMVWTLQPSMSAHDVAKVLFDSAVFLAETSDFQFGAPQLSRRISVCEATKMACAGSPHCAVPPTCPVSIAYADRRPSGFVTPAATLRVSGTSLINPFVFGAPCHAITIATTTTAPAIPCPAQQFYHRTAGPWVHPQPPGPICTVCFLKGNVLGINLSDDILRALSAATISVVYKADGTAKRYDLGIEDSELTPGAQLEVFDLPFYASDLKKATIEFALDDKLSSSDPLLLNP